MHGRTCCGGRGRAGSCGLGKLWANTDRVGRDVSRMGCIIRRMDVACKKCLGSGHTVQDKERLETETKTNTDRDNPLANKSKHSVNDWDIV